jgi:peptidoglycan hydrolase-like protein with peptidoglycan-binding domain
MGETKGVVAFRESEHAKFLTPPGNQEPANDTETSPASTSTTRTALPTLRRGSKGAEVKIVQQKLGLLPVDGSFGPATEAGVKNFQARNGLTPDGVVGPKTWAALMGGSA